MLKLFQSLFFFLFSTVVLVCRRCGGGNGREERDVRGFVWNTNFPLPYFVFFFLFACL